MKKYIYLLLVIPLFITSCNDDSDEPKTSFADFAIVDISETSEFDLVILPKNRPDHIFVKKNRSNNNIATSIIYNNGFSNKNVTIFFTDEGLLDKIFFDNNTLIFKNFNGNKFDCAIVKPNNDIEILREIETNFDFNKNTSPKSQYKLSDTESILEWISNSFDLISCVSSAVQEALSGSVALGMKSSFDCGLNFGEELGQALRNSGYRIYVSQEFYDNFNDIYDTYDSLSKLFDCVTDLDIDDCVSLILGIIDDALIEHQNEVINNDNIYLAESALEHGHGDVQITLTWDNGADLDLHVVDPNGEEIFYYHPYSASNGKLDVDDRNGYGPENIFWPQLEAPNGTYKVYVHHYPSSPSSSNYTVLINAFGVTKTYTGSITYDQIIHIKDFDHNGFKSALDKNSFSITTNAIK